MRNFKICFIKYKFIVAICENNDFTSKHWPNIIVHATENHGRTYRCSAVNKTD